MESSIINRAISAVISMAGALNLFDDIGRGPLGPHAGLRMELAPGGTYRCHMDRKCVARCSVVINAKHRDWQYLSDAVGTLLDALSRASEYPREEAWQITGIAVTSPPQLIAREPGDLWLCAATIQLTIYY